MHIEIDTSSDIPGPIADWLQVAVDSGFRPPFRVVVVGANGSYLCITFDLDKNEGILLPTGEGAVSDHETMNTPLNVFAVDGAGACSSIASSSRRIDQATLEIDFWTISIFAFRLYR